MPCKTMKSRFAEFSTQLPESATAKIVDIDDEIELTQQYNIRSIPTIIFEKNNQVVDRLSGIQTVEKLNETLAKYENQN